MEKKLFISAIIRGIKKHHQTLYYNKKHLPNWICRVGKCVFRRKIIKGGIRWKKMFYERSVSSESNFFCRILVDTTVKAWYGLVMSLIHEMISDNLNLLLLNLSKIKKSFITIPSFGNDSSAINLTKAIKCIINFRCSTCSTRMTLNKAWRTIFFHSTTFIVIFTPTTRANPRFRIRNNNLK